MAEKNAMLVMRDVSKTFNPGTVNEKCALKNLNLTLKQGEFATIVGVTEPENQRCLMR